MSLFEAVRPAMHAAVRKVLQHHKLSEHGDATVEADLIYAVLDNLGVGEVSVKSNTRSAMPSEVIEAALLLKRWATERNEAPGWHIAGIGEVDKDRVTVASVHAAARAVYAIQLLQAGSTRMADGRWGSIKMPSDEAMSYALGAMIELNNELSSLFHRNPPKPLGDWLYEGKADPKPAAAAKSFAPVDFDYLAPWPMPGVAKPSAPPSTMLDRDQCLAVIREAGLGHLAFNEDNVAMLSRLCNKAVEAAFRRPAKGG